MFLRHPFLVRAIFPAAFALTLLSGNALATTYVIESTNDIVADDDVCTLREAVTASITLEASEDCEAGTGTDKIQLKEGLTYTLTLGELVVGGEIIPELDINGDLDTTDLFLDDSARDGAGTQPLPLPLIPYTSGQPTKEKAPVAADPEAIPPVPAEPGIDINGDGDFVDTFIIVREYPERPINVLITFEVEPKDAFDKTIKENPVIVATNGARIFNVVTGSRISISNITLDGGVGTTGPAAGNGGLILSQGSVALLKRTQLVNGVAVDGGAIFMDGANVPLALDDVAFIGNTASGNGGAIATSSATTGLLAAKTSYFENNVAAQGGAIFLDGTSPAMALENSTFYANSASAVDGGGAINLFAGERVAALNNVTIAGQADGGGVAFAAAVGTVNDTITNSVIVGNVDGSCVGDAAAITAAYGAYVVHQGGSCPLDVDGFVYVGPNPGDVVSNQSGTADFSVLAYKDSGTNLFVDCTAADGPAACTPMEFSDAGWKGFVPSLVDSIGAVDSVPTAFNSASPREATVDVCASKDQRLADREDDCDAGAIELRAAKGTIDEFTVVDGVSTLVDVLENDLGDTEVDCSLVPLGELCMTIDVQPTRGGAIVEYDVNNYPQIRYQSSVNFHGVDTLHYVLDKRAVSSLTFVGADVGAQVNMVVEPQSGLTKSESIGNGSGTGTGSFGLVSGLLLLLAGLMRTYGQRYLRLFIALVFSAAASNSLFAAVITVNSLLDQATYGDGQCTLREAINNATDSAPLFSPDCASGATGRDTIELPDGVITLATPLVVPTNTSLDIIGTGADVDADDLTGTTIDGNNVTRLFLASSSLLLKNMTLRNGNAAGGDGGVVITSANLTLEGVLVSANTAANGGAIYLNYNTGLSRTLTIKRSEFRGNSAALNGGVLSMSGQNQKHALLVDSSSFIGNTATGKGGALDVNLPLGGSLNVLNSTFSGNTAATGDAIDLTDIVAPAAIMNSTFLNQDVAIDVGDIDSTTVKVQMHNSIYAGAAPNACSTGTGMFVSSDYNLYATTDASCIQGPNDNIQPLTDITNILSAGTLAPATGEGDDFVPSHYAVNPADANAGWVLDMGDGTANQLAEGASSPTKCRTVDTRGAARTSGGSCDIGAYELQVATAVNDTGSNAGRAGSFAIIDILKNDLVGESGYIVPYAIDLDTTNNGVQAPDEVDTGNAPGPDILTPDKLAKIRLVAKEDVLDPQQDCGANVGLNGPDAPAECVLRYEAPTFTDCADLNNYSDTFEYTVVINDAEDFTGTSTKALTGEVTVTLVNAPPDSDDITRQSEPGRTEVFPFNPVDPDAVGGITSITDYEVTQAPINAKYEILDQEKVFLGVGIIVNETAGTVTYIPDSNLSPFDDRFQLSYKDECGVTGSTTFIIDYPREDASGDVLGGSISFAFSTFGLLLVMRRKQAKK